MKNIKKVIATIMLFVVLFCNTNIIVFAEASFDKAKMLVLSDTEEHIQCNLGSGWFTVNCYMIGYEENGKVYPAYCIDKDLPGPEDFSNSYTVDVGHTIVDDKLWRTITSGYPYKSIEELGVETAWDAFMATKQAIYCILYDREVDDYYRAITDRGAKIINAMKVMVDEGRNGTRYIKDPKLTINKASSLSLVDDYYVQAYSLSSRVNIQSYKVNKINYLPEGSIITDKDNIQKDEYLGTEKIYIKIPKNKMNENIKYNLEIKAKCETYPVFYGIAPSVQLQNQILTYSIYGDEIAEIEQEIDVNTGSILVRKVDKENKTPIKDVKIELYNNNLELIAIDNTNEQGYMFFTGLKQGIYYLKEVLANEEYTLDSTMQPVNVIYNNLTEYEMTNEVKTGKIQIEKVSKDDESIKIKGVRFEVLDSNKNKLEEIVTDGNGIAQTSLLPSHNKTYYIKEIEVDENYIKDETLLEIKMQDEEVKKVTITNELKKNKIEIEVVSKKDNSIKLEGAILKVYDENKVEIEELKTDENGTAETSLLPSHNKKYYIKQISTNEEYQIDEEEKPVELKDSDEKIILENTIKEGNIVIEKVSNKDSRIKLEGVEFEILNEKKEVVDRLKTDKDGIATSKLLPSFNRKYYIKETKTNEEYNLLEEEIEVCLEEGKETKKQIENKLKENKIEIEVVSKKDNSIKLSGAILKVYDENKVEIEELKTDENGKAETTFLPSHNKKYYIKQISTNEEYLIDVEEKLVELKDSDEKIILENKLKEGNIVIEKVSKDDENIKIKGVKFEVLDSDKNKLEEIVTDGSGIAKTSLMPSHNKTYYIKEIEVDENYVKDETLLEIKMQDEEVKKVTITNELKKNKIEIEVVSKKDNNIKLEGAILKVYDENKVEIEELKTDENGKAKTRLLPSHNQKYYIKQISTNEEYQIDEEEKTVELKDSDEKIILENTIKEGNIVIEKVSNKDSRIKLEGVEFEILNEKREVVDRLKTDKDGIATSKLLPSFNRKYYIKETKTNEEYNLLKEEIEVCLEEGKETKKQIENTLKENKIEIEVVSKKDNSIKLEGAILKVYDENKVEIEELKTDENGKAETRLLPSHNKNYYIKQVNIVNEYLENTNIYEVLLNEKDETLIIENTLVKKLPKTGY